MILESILHDHSPVPSKVMKDLIAGGTFLETIAKAPYHLEAFVSLANAQKGYSSETREVVADAFERQNSNLSAAEEASLKAFRDGALTITTGHQLMVCGGTVFFEAKVLGAIALAKEVSKALSKHVVPVFWMATEDHDFEEIASFRIGEYQFTWNKPESKGPVGNLSTHDLLFL